MASRGYVKRRLRASAATTVSLHTFPPKPRARGGRAGTDRTARRSSRYLAIPTALLLDTTASRQKNGWNPRLNRGAPPLKTTPASQEWPPANRLSISRHPLRRQPSRPVARCRIPSRCACRPVQATPTHDRDRHPFRDATHRRSRQRLSRTKCLWESRRSELVRTRHPSWQVIAICSIAGRCTVSSLPHRC